MGVKEDGMWTGTGLFLLIGIITAVITGIYVRNNTKDRSQAQDNMR